MSVRQPPRFQIWKRGLLIAGKSVNQRNISHVHIGQSRSNALNILLALCPIAAEIFLEKHIHHHQLGDFGSHGAKLEGAFVGAAAQHHICQLGSRGFGEPGNQNGFDTPCLGNFQHLQTVGGGAGVGKQDDDAVLFQRSHGRHLPAG